MDTMAGLDRLRTCLLQIDTSAEISDLILYKYGNRIIQEYASNRIITTLTSSEETEIREKSFVVKCFCHSEIYVAWQSSAGFGNSKYYVSKSELLKFEESSKIYTEVYPNKDFQHLDGGNTFRRIVPLQHGLNPQAGQGDFCCFWNDFQFVGSPAFVGLDEPLICQGRDNILIFFLVFVLDGYTKTSANIGAISTIFPVLHGNHGQYLKFRFWQG